MKRRTWKVIMICSNGNEVVLDSFRTQEQADRKAEIYTRKDAYEVSIGYAPTNTRYEARFC